MEASTTTSSSKTPADFLKSIRGKRVVVKLNSGVDYRGILTHTVLNFAVSQGRRKKEIVRSFVRLLLYYTTTLVHINRGVVRDIDTSSSSSSFCKTGILACLDGYMNIAMEHTEVRTDCRLFS
jgi:small nuclear ribonucleoprotein (snRNP)-like protein